MTNGDNENGGLTEAAIAELKSRYPGVELRLAKAPDGSEIVFRAPDLAIYSAFMSDVTNEKKDKAVSMNAYALKCVIHPTPQAAAQTFARFPAFSGVLARELNEMAGSVDELDVKKL